MNAGGQGGGGRVLHPERRVRKLAVVVAVQNVLVAACLVVTLFVYRDAQRPASADDVHIYFDTIPSIEGNVTLQCEHVHSSHMMGLVHEKIQANCTGPYVLYIDVCFKSMKREALRAELQLRVSGSPLASFSLNTSHEVCTGLHQFIYLRARQGASLHLTSPPNFKVNNVTVGLSYLLGTRCEF